LEKHSLHDPRFEEFYDDRSARLTEQILGVLNDSCGVFLDEHVDEGINFYKSFTELVLLES